MNLHKSALLIIGIFVLVVAKAQYNHPADGELFDDKELITYHVTLSQADLDVILAPGNEWRDDEYPASVHILSSALDTTIELVGFRLRGNTSRNSAKKSFKIAMNAFEQGRDYKGLEKFNINGEHNDPSIIRSKLGWDLMKDAGAIASRCNHVKLYINNEYKGLYVHVEHIDEEFIEERFGNKDGNLYKCLWPARLDYRGSNPEEYKWQEGGNRRVYELKTNEALDDYSGLAHFIDVLNNTSDQQFKTEIEKVLDVESFLRAFAVEVLIGHWDNYSINKNNYYLYDNPDDGLFYYIPYDLDNTYGVDWLNEDWHLWNIYDFISQNDDLPLAKRIMQVPEFKFRFTEIIVDLLVNHFKLSVVNTRVSELKEIIIPAAEEDIYKEIDWGFTNDDFHQSYSTRLEIFHVRYGLLEWVDKRYETAVAQIEDIEIPVGLSTAPEINVFPNPILDEINISFDKKGRYQIEVMDLTGRIIFSQFIQSDSYSFEFNPALEKAIYLLRILDSNALELHTQKIISTR